MIQVRPTQAFFKPGEIIRLHVECSQASQQSVQATLFHLGATVAVWESHASEQVIILEGHVPPDVRRGYLVRVQCGEETAFTAFDVLTNWTQAPRYGYLYDFSSGRSAENIGATLDYLLALHINGLQFYDWQYRHDTLLPPQDDFIDPLARTLSLSTIRQLIEAAHQRSMAAMPYTAIYAASPAFAAAHTDWQLYDESGQPVDFADGFLKLMNLSSEWQAHFVEECGKVLNGLPFDGIHVDQYGEPRTGFDWQGKPVDIPAGFVATLESLRKVIPQDKPLLFNLVHNWPAQNIAPSPLDFWYSELWPPVTELSQLWETIRDNRRLNPRPAVLAVYIPPEWEETVIAAQSTILAAGGSHIAHGEHGRYLSDPYFPRAGLPSAMLVARLQQLADFALAYEELLVFASDVTDQWIDRITINGDHWAAGRLIVHQTGNRLIINLLPATGHWNEVIAPVQPQSGVQLTVMVDHVQRGWWASLEHPLPSVMADWQLPPFQHWLLICLELQP